MVALLETRRIEPDISANEQAPQSRKHSERADKLFDAGLFEQALPEYEAALEVDPSNPYLHNNRGATLAHLGRLDEAVEDFARASNLLGRVNPVLSRNHALALAELGRFKEALAVLDALGKRVHETDSAKVRRSIVEMALRDLVRSGFASWDGGKPKGSKNPIKLTPGPSITEMIHEGRR
ncbi:MAG TPA: tetratricopeptide repeat protein [Dehalococcoidia bacterium]|nr:tetratricopeptide repeat protein [Dehalococcoidia bacterium]